MNHPSQGFSLIELLIALTVTLALSAMMFHLFHQNERVISDQTLIMEMQQSARIVASQIADEVRMAGQGVPVYAASFDGTPSEPVAVILGSSTAGRMDFRAGLSNVETRATTFPLDFTVGVSRSVSVASTSGFVTGAFIYMSSGWNWLRAEITSLSSFAMIVTPRDTTAGGSTIHFSAAPVITLEEAVSISLNGGSVRRATASGMTDPANPSWSPANEIGRNFTALTFTYYDAFGNAVQPSSLSNRTAIVRVHIALTVETAKPLRDGSRPRYSLDLQTIPRALRLRPSPM
jgi:prepilin-type N-terminal cleavage/methylation domain-containing protein